MGGLAVVLAIALAVVITVLVVRPDSDGRSAASTTVVAPEFASAGDVGPVNIITEDPTCAAWGKIARGYSEKAQTVNWANRDFSIAARDWTLEQRAMYDAVGEALSSAADQAVNLVKQTSHRVMRELYEQFVAFSKEFVKRIPTYSSKDDSLAVTTDAFATGIADICSAIEYQSAAAVAPLVTDPPPPSNVLLPGDPAASNRFISSSNATCDSWSSVVLKFSDQTRDWRAIDPSISATEWSSEEKKVIGDAGRTMLSNADELERLGRDSKDPVQEDFAVLAAQYWRAYSAALPSYSPADNFLSEAATLLVKAIDWACKGTT